MVTLSITVLSWIFQLKTMKIKSMKSTIIVICQVQNHFYSTHLPYSSIIILISFILSYKAFGSNMMYSRYACVCFFVNVLFVWVCVQVKVWRSKHTFLQKKRNPSSVKREVCLCTVMSDHIEKYTVNCWALPSNRLC